jgi:hypothetical protein
MVFVSLHFGAKMQWALPDFRATFDFQFLIDAFLCGEDRDVMGLLENLSKIARMAKIIGMILVAIAICWRGTTFSDPVGSGVVPVLMCLAAGVSLALLAFSQMSQPATTTA